VKAALRLAAAGALALACGAALATAAIKPWSAGPTPALAMPDLAGRAFDLKRLRGRVVLVNFWATWCEPCRDEMPSLQRLRERMEGKPFDVVTVNYGEGAERIRAFMERERLALAVLPDRDKQAAEAWGARGLPMTFLVDARGAVRYSTFGERDWSEGEGLRLVESLVAEVPGARR
jgi:thiol-disulfide isomerase/thioredoxin